MRIGFNCAAVPGRINPMAVLARELQRRGHEVVLFTFLSKPGVRAAGVPCFPFVSRYLTPENA
jgi:UDP:flavonoid glycosyltransferase YjiC (YdhE family)